jgi:hypothetical protein
LAHHRFFVIGHGRRRILHFNVTEHPTAERVVQQLREAFPEAGPYRYAIFDTEFWRTTTGANVIQRQLEDFRPVLHGDGSLGQCSTERVHSGPGSTQVIEKITSGKGGNAPSLPDGYTYSL